MFGVSNAKNLAFDTLDANALRLCISKLGPNLAAIYNQQIA